MEDDVFGDDFTDESPASPPKAGGYSSELASKKIKGSEGQRS